MERFPKLKTYLIEYRDTSDPHIRFTGRWRGYDREHASERFYEAEDSDGWEIVSIKLAPQRR